MASSLVGVEAEAMRLELRGRPGGLALRARLSAGVWVALLLFFARTPQHTAAKNTGQKNREHDIVREKYEGPRTNQPTKVYTHQTCFDTWSTVRL